jgi:hypothetical protein
MSDEARPAELYAYCFNKYGRERVEDLLNRTSSWTTKEELECYATEYREIGLPVLAAIMEDRKAEAPNQADIRLCNWTLTYRSLEDMKDCRLPDGKSCNCWANREFW